MSSRSDIAIYTAFEDHQTADSAEAEKNLMRAVLQSAMDDMQRTGERYREARQYFVSNDDQYVFSFLSVCYHLDLCSKTIRKLVGVHPRPQMGNLRTNQSEPEKVEEQNKKPLAA